MNDQKLKVIVLCWICILAGIVLYLHARQNDIIESEVSRQISEREQSLLTHFNKSLTDLQVLNGLEVTQPSTFEQFIVDYTEACETTQNSALLNQFMNEVRDKK